MSSLITTMHQVMLLQLLLACHPHFLLQLACNPSWLKVAAVLALKVITAVISPLKKTETHLQRIQMTANRRESG
ncbi:hypothetical protein SERLA73DRAFT_183701 [Serpula lacrymans var. lacrymans S7.3]|uniref:Secreted protein n=2 Tax=Serpula lacrymans var. lacrymans TaxID=341189 RepID=F8Q3L5_SERL3|nr:uncharacterized protein SERLADRAFT_471025 [Serpula lacrymans var. lacrymans S7.9]EGN97100.1 hypothetical protein SERLA73DRAFT_183701 [Serpula lacrymans var. lacrymans S7.3]EGO22706.1 hypothetical protein SERLADRAFT_471025 [Serpula lacrymans var. lacrymans S7.9]